MFSMKKLQVIILESLFKERRLFCQRILKYGKVAICIRNFSIHWWPFAVASNQWRLLFKKGYHFNFKTDNVPIKLRFFVKVHCKGMPLRLHFKGGHYLSADTIAILQYVLKRWHMGEWRLFCIFVIRMHKGKQAQILVLHSTTILH